MKTRFKTLVILGMLTVSSAVKAQDKIIQLAQLPQQAQQFINSYASKLKISYIKLEDELFSKKSYEVKMQDGSELEFDHKGAWKEVDFNHNTVPNIIVPQSIKNYVNKSFPNNNIVKISRNSSKFEIELSNGLDLEFNKKGKFLRIDD